MKTPKRMPAVHTIDRAAIDGVITRNLSRLKQPGVLTVRPGYEFAGARITGRPAIPLAVLSDPAALQDFLSVLDWYISEVRAR